MSRMTLWREARIVGGLLVGIALMVAHANAQTYAPQGVAPGYRPGQPMVDNINRVQAIPETPAPSIPSNLIAPGAAADISDLTVGAAERGYGGGAPTIEVAQEEAAAEEEGTLLMSLLGLEDSPIQVYGWIQNSFTGNPSQPADGINFGVTPNYKANEWMGNQYYTVFENVLEHEDEINFGFRADVLFGNDWEFNKMKGVFDGAWPSGYFPGLDLAQFYGEVHLPVLTEGGLDVKFGRWYSLHGYEVVPAVGRPLLSVPYMFTYGQPFTHWGLMTNWNVTDNLVVYNGIPQGWDTFQIESRAWGYMGGFSWTGLEDKMNLTFIYSRNAHTYNRFFYNNSSIIQPNSFSYTNDNINLFTTVLSYKWTDELTQVMETDQGIENGIPEFDGDTVTNNIDGTWYSFGNWFLYNFSDKLTGVWRSEVFWDTDGVRTGAADRYYAQTLGMIYKPTPNIWVRPEARYDWAQFGTPYNAGVSDSQFTFGGDIIFLF